GLTTAGGTQPWAFVDEVIMVGGSCRMPMIPALLEEMSGGRHEVRRPEGFDFATAAAIGAAVYPLRPASVRDVSPETYGVKLKSTKGDRYVVHPLVHKNARLPVTVEQEFKAGANAVLELYQGSSPVVSECVRRGRLELSNPEGMVRVILHMDDEGTLSVACVLPNGERRTLTIQNEFYDARTTDLAARVRGIGLAPCPATGAGASASPAAARSTGEPARTAAGRAAGALRAATEGARIAAETLSARTRSFDLDGTKERLDELRNHASRLVGTAQALAQRRGDRPQPAPDPTPDS